MARRENTSLCEKCGLEIFVTHSGYKLDFPDGIERKYLPHSCDSRRYVIEEIKQRERLEKVPTELPPEIVNPLPDVLEELGNGRENYNCPYCGFPNNPELESVVTCNGCGMEFFSDRDYGGGKEIYNDENFIEAWTRFDRIPGVRQKEIFRELKVDLEFLEKNREFLSRAKLQIKTGKEISKERERLEKIKHEAKKERARERYHLNKEKKKREIEKQKEKNFQETGFRETNKERDDRILRKIATSEKIEEGCIVEICGGAFCGQAARVTRVTESKEEVTVELVEPIPLALTVRADWLFVISKNKR